MAEAVSTFISYSRTDSDFVDRLEADLRARGFKTWVDRRKLEGTREWQPQIDHAITEYPMMIVVLSPDAVASLYVRHEYEYAHQLGKRLVTLLHKPNLPTVPPELSEIQWVDFVNRPYETALVELIDGCQDPSFDQASDPRTLYNQAHDLESTDPERATVLYQRLINRAPTYSGGRPQLDLDRLKQRLYPQRVQRLREQAEAAHKEGQYGAEAGALEALVALGDHDHATFAWAKAYLVVAQQNSKWLDTYENVKHFISSGDLDSARDLLPYLWQMENAPFFRDPAGIAAGLGLKVPITYEQWKEERQANEAKTKQERNAATERDAQIMQAESKTAKATSEELVKWQTACNVARNDLDHAWTQPLALLSGWSAVSDEAASSLMGQWKQWHTDDQQLSRRRTFQIRWLIATALLILGIVVFDCAFLLPGIIYGMLWTLFVTVVEITLIVCFSLIVAYSIWKSRELRHSLAQQKSQVVNQVNWWLSLSEPEHKRKLSSIEIEQQEAMSEAQAQYQRRMDEITADHKRELADIEARYAGS